MMSEDVCYKRKTVPSVMSLPCLWLMWKLNFCSLPQYLEIRKLLRKSILQNDVHHAILLLGLKKQKICVKTILELLSAASSKTNLYCMLAKNRSFFISLFFFVQTPLCELLYEFHGLCPTASVRFWSRTTYYFFPPSFSVF